MNNKFLKVFTSLNGRDLNKILANYGFYPNQLMTKKASLEDVFMEITQ